MVGDAWLTYIEFVCDLARIHVAFLEHLEDAATGGILERLEEKVHRMVSYFEKPLINVKLIYLGPHQ